MTDSFEEKEDKKEITEDNEEENVGEIDQKRNKRRRKRKRKKKSDNPEDSEKQNNSLPAEEQIKTAQTERTVFVEGIPYDCSVEQVKEFFQTHLGENQDNENIIEDCRLPVWQDTGRLRGYGHVVLSSDDLYQKALTCNRKYLGSRYLNIQPANAPRGGGGGGGANQQQLQDPSKVIILNNLSYDANEDDIQAVLEKHGKNIVEGGVRVVRYSQSGRSKGFAYVEFDSIKAAKQVVSSGALIIKNRSCRLDYDHGRMKGSFRTQSGRQWQKEHGHREQYDSNKRGRFER